MIIDFWLIMFQRFDICNLYGFLNRNQKFYSNDTRTEFHSRLFAYKNTKLNITQASVEIHGLRSSLSEQGWMQNTKKINLWEPTHLEYEILRSQVAEPLQLHKGSLFLEAWLLQWLHWLSYSLF